MDDVTKTGGLAPERRWARVLLGLLALGVVLRLPTFFRPMLSDDEAIYATTADALRRGDLLYRDVVDHKPPLIYHVYQAGFAVLGPYDTHGAHALVVLAVLATAVLLWAALRKQDGGAALATAALYLIFSTTWHDYDALAANCELFLLAAQAAAACLLLRDFARPPAGARRLGLHLTIGFLIGISALFKYQGLTFLGVGLGMLAWSLLLGRMAFATAAGLALAELAGAVAPAAAYLAWCAGAGNASATLYWFRFNFSYVGAGLRGTAALARGLSRTAMIGGSALVPYLLGGAAAVVTAVEVAGMVRPSSRSALDTGPPPASAVLGLLWLATSAIALGTGGRFFGHYFHLILGPLCLLAGPPTHRLWNRGGVHRATLAVLTATPALLFFALASVARPLAARLDEGEPPYQAVATRIVALTAPEDRIFVWGNSPQLYLLARRPMGSRFSFCNYMTGESPGTPTETGQWSADANQLPAAWDMLFADLEARRPALFVDAAAAGWDGYDKFPVTRYPRLRDYLERHYRPAETEAGVVLYRRVR